MKLHQEHSVGFAFIAGQITSEIPFKLPLVPFHISVGIIHWIICQC